MASLSLGYHDCILSQALVNQQIPLSESTYVSAELDKLSSTKTTDLSRN